MYVGHYHGSQGIETEDQDAVGLTSILDRGQFSIFEENSFLTFFNFRFDRSGEDGKPNTPRVIKFEWNCVIFRKTVNF